MKTKRRILSALLLMIAGISHTQPYAGHKLQHGNTGTGRSERKPCFLYMKGTIQKDMMRNNDNLVYINHARVTMLNKKTKDSATVYSDSAGLVEMKLPLDENFVIRISRNGYVTKIIQVNTRIPDQRWSDYTLKFDAFLFEDIAGIDVSSLKNPIANIWFNNPYNGFDYNYSYTDMINEQLKRKYIAYYRNHPAQPYLETAIHTLPLAVKPVSLYETRIHPMSAPVVVFAVQIIATRTPRHLASVFFQLSGLTNEIYADGLYKYTVGDFATVEEAENKRTELRRLGYTDAFVVAQWEERRIPLPDAVKLVSQ
jgi:hypothetical protein